MFIAEIGKETKNQLDHDSLSVSELDPQPSKRGLTVVLEPLSYEETYLFPSARLVERVRVSLYSLVRSQIRQLNRQLYLRKRLM